MPTKRKRAVKHNPSRRKPSARNPRIAITYEIITHESAEQGDAEERGWIDETGVSMKPDKYDTQDGVTAVQKAVRFLQEEGVSEASSSSFHPGVWYTNYEYDEDYSTGDRETRSYHLKNFSEAEERAIFNAVARRRY